MTATEVLELAGALGVDMGPAVLLAVYLEARELDQPVPSLNVAADRAGVKWDTVKRWQVQLVDAGLVELTDGAGRQPSAVTVCLDQLPRFALPHYRGRSYPEIGEGSYPEIGEGTFDLDAPSPEIGEGLTPDRGKAAGQPSGSARSPMCVLYPEDEGKRQKHTTRARERRQSGTLTPADVVTLTAYRLSAWGRVVVRLRNGKPLVRRRLADNVVTELAASVGGLDQLFDLVDQRMTGDRFPGDRNNLDIVLSDAGVNALYNAGPSRGNGAPDRRATLDGKELRGLTMADLAARQAELEGTGQ